MGRGKALGVGVNANGPHDMLGQLNDGVLSRCARIGRQGAECVGHVVLQVWQQALSI